MIWPMISTDSLIHDFEEEHAGDHELLNLNSLELTQWLLHLILDSLEFLLNLNNWHANNEEHLILSNFRSFDEEVTNSFDAF